MNEKIRILYLITDLGKGGAERFLIDLCNELNKRNDVDFLIGSLYDNNQYINNTANFNIVNLNYNTFSFTHKNDCLEYKRILKEFKPHIIHTHRFLAEYLTSYYVDRNIKYVCHGHDNMVQLENFSFKTLFNKRLLLNFIEKQILVWKKYKQVDSFLISNSTDTYNYYKSVLPKKINNNVHLIECGINYNRFYNSIKKEVFGSKKLKLINIGSFQDKKNQIFIIDIALEFKRRGHLFEIHLLGDGQNWSKVQKAVFDNGLDECVFLHGNVGNVEHWLREADIYIHTAWYEPFGLVLIEAMAAGLPIITLDGKGNRDVIENGKNGFIIKNQNSIEFVDKLEFLKDNPVIYKDISEYAKKFAQKYEISLKVNELVDFYHSIL